MKWFLSGILLITCYSQLAWSYSDAEVERELMNEARRRSAALPYETNSIKMIAITAGPGRRLTYMTIIKGQLSVIKSPTWAAQRRGMLINAYCTDPSFQNFREDLVTVSWHDMASNGVNVLVTDVSPKDCSYRR